MFPLAGVLFSVPPSPQAGRWTVRSLLPATHETVKLEFLPTGTREDHTHVLGLLVSDFVQPFGSVQVRAAPADRVCLCLTRRPAGIAAARCPHRHANATLEFRPEGTDLLYRVNLDSVFGVMEDHVAVW